MLEALLLINWLFWAPLVVWLALMCWCMDHETGWGALASTLALIVAFWLFREINPLTWTTDHLRELVTYGIIYLVGALGWPFLKWYFFARAIFLDYDEKRDELMRTATKREVNWDEVVAAKNYIKFENGSPARDVAWEFDKLKSTHKPPIVAEHKRTILMWMAWWPFSFIWTLLNDPFRRLILFLYRQIARSLQAMSDHVFAKYRAELG